MCLLPDSPWEELAISAAHARSGSHDLRASRYELPPHTHLPIKRESPPEWLDVAEHKDPQFPSRSFDLRQSYQFSKPRSPFASQRSRNRSRSPPNDNWRLRIRSSPLSSPSTARKYRCRINLPVRSPSPRLPQGKPESHKNLDQAENMSQEYLAKTFAHLRIEPKKKRKKPVRPLPAHSPSAPESHPPDEPLGQITEIAQETLEIALMRLHISSAPC
ncbi:hypothetical protein N7495_005930 [Penicillium taxi]|uniref:uncharacterized protein n=1 Tax=Penicillium taxi TaxID=168475 RepID=UPI0025453214|nr:uncharacterized protein N7495_005930 [Penicillium taxi]KAJ5894239.1 hypothetical protein N7495_005930 [Penicillium taxi]